MTNETIAEPNQIRFAKNTEFEREFVIDENRITASLRYLGAVRDITTFVARWRGKPGAASSAGCWYRGALYEHISCLVAQYPNEIRTQSSIRGSQA